MQLHNFTSAVSITSRHYWCSRPRSLECFLCEARSIAFAAGHVAAEALSGFQAVDVLSIAAHELAGVSEGLDEFVDG